MTTLAWSPALALHHPQMDATHQEFVDLLAAAEAARTAEPATLLSHWQALCDHTVDHFAQEDRWMADTGFAAENCHSFQHKAVLDVMLECARRAREEADFEPLHLAIGELAVWFPQHAQMMDAALVEHMARLGHDPATGRCAAELVGAGAAPTAAPTAAPITGCGGSSCG